MTIKSLCCILVRTGNPRGGIFMKKYFFDESVGEFFKRFKFIRVRGKTLKTYRVTYTEDFIDVETLTTSTRILCVKWERRIQHAYETLKTIKIIIISNKFCNALNFTIFENYKELTSKEIVEGVNRLAFLLGLEEGELKIDLGGAKIGEA